MPPRPPRPSSSRARERLGLLALAQHRPREALHWFEAERRVLDYRDGLDFRRGQVAEAEGDLPRALTAYRRELRRNPDAAAARDSAAAIEARLAR